MRRWLLLALLIAACAQPPVHDEVTIEFSSDSDSVVVTAATRFELHPRTAEARKRVEIAREAAQSATDAWSIRFGRLTPDFERVTMQRDHGTLESVTRTIRIPADDLQRVFSDTGVTVNVARGDGWRELAFYPGAGGRATREQQRRFNEQLDAWSGDVARYINAVHHLYSYLEEQPGRAQYVFAALLAGKDEDAPPVLEDEEPLVNAVMGSIEKIAARMDQQNEHAETFAESADLIFNPFPARITVKLPNDPIAREGFGDDLVIEPIDLFKSIAALEGRWVTPDLFSAMMQDESVTAKQIAEMPRRATAVASATDVAAVLREQLAHPKSYVVRWRD